ncbi:NAD(P)/FAD-dependent oxidoreductase [Aspergillus clavatus NRRL 1]|uniref:Fructosyl amino acid oxidasesarcosine oxidase, putative n=1 Tax=Aspergillus clavatus (strain ATCC 1007 / CBS 513.65 / DSM 816 / NCTC 3887 / NRRL 1 / QM 1276 / 107) TaxID=344612 RepID=A1CKB5_ASPCL|nr:fructosyl amino acid oxidasesarcosine oxidase, putative [Aspergillus clavatus NRRL 1]EAW09589.1 fructosyl amino acid oxidasesarcosine oxidase, putative [Aspergillus clavatus NRRL 1]
MAVPQKILIVGGGVFGLSTALSLSQRHPTCQITLLEQSATIPNPHGSSVDSSRIVRADYSHPVYAKLAAAAIDRWRNTEWGTEGRYTQNGLLLVYTPGNDKAKDYATKSYQNVKGLESDSVQLLPSAADVMKIVPEYGRELNVAGGYINWGSGWADAEAGVRFAKKKLDEAGKVAFKTGEVDRLLYAEVQQADDSSHRRVTGVILTDGTTLTADLVVLATGAWTGKLVDLRGRAISTGQALAYLRISDDEQRQLENLPTILNFANGIFIIPPRNNLLKIARHAYGYHNPKAVPVPGGNGSGSGSETNAATMHVSLPEDGVPVPPEGQEALRTALHELLPSFTDREFVKTRVCWYTDTPTGDFIIDHHPNHPGLFLATGGSGHGYKFFPVLGDKIVDALEGNLEPELRELWRWRDAVGPAAFEGDGSRSGAQGLLLMEELAKGRKALRKSVL